MELVKDHRLYNVNFNNLENFLAEDDFLTKCTNCDYHFKFSD